MVVFDAARHGESNASQRRQQHSDHVSNFFLACVFDLPALFVALEVGSVCACCSCVRARCLVFGANVCVVVVVVVVVIVGLHATQTHKIQKTHAKKTHLCFCSVAVRMSSFASTTKNFTFATLLQLARPTKAANGRWHKPKLSGRRVAVLRKQALMSGDPTWDETAMRKALVCE